jgi:hypothetical protein
MARRSRAPAFIGLLCALAALGAGCEANRASGSAPHSGARQHCPVPRLSESVIVRERFWSFLKTVDVFQDTPARTLLGYVYVSPFTLDGVAKWVSALDGRVLATSLEQMRSAPTMTILPQLAPTLSVMDCHGIKVADVDFALDALLTVKTPGGAVAATSAVGGKDDSYITVRDETGRVRTRIRRLSGGWTDQWKLTILGAGGDPEEAIKGGKRLKTAEAEMRVLTQKARFLEKAGKRIEGAAVEIEVQALRERVSELEREQRSRDTKLTRGALANDPRVLILAIAAESPAINVGMGIQLAKAPVYVFGATMILGWGLCCCYLGKHFYTSRGADVDYTEMKQDWRDAKMMEDGTGRDRLESLLLLKDRPVALRRSVRTGD